MREAQGPPNARPLLAWRHRAGKLRNEGQARVLISQHAGEPSEPREPLLEGIRRRVVEQVVIPPRRGPLSSPGSPLNPTLIAFPANLYTPSRSLIYSLFWLKNEQLGRLTKWLGVNEHEYNEVSKTCEGLKGI